MPGQASPAARRPPLNFVLLRRPAHIYIEFALAAAILFVIVKAFLFLRVNGFLPPPFFEDVSDTFMDWYNTVYWGHRDGTYSEWYSVYPPFAIVFMNLLSSPSCYSDSPTIGRACDPLPVYLLTALLFVNTALAFVEYRKADRRTAWPRALAVGLGASALFGWERANVIVCCLTFFILAHGTLLRSTWLRWICFAVTANLKPYLIVAVIGRLLHRKWRWFEGCAVATMLIYAASYMILGRGSPFELARDIFTFSAPQENITMASLNGSTTYNSVIEALRTQLPLTFYLGSSLIETVEAMAPWFIKIADLAVLMCLVGAVFRPRAIPSRRLAALALVALLTNSKSLGPYAEVFLFFLVFFEKWNSVGQALAIMSVYLLAIPWDMIVVTIIHINADSWLSGKLVGLDSGLTFGGLARPALLLVVQYSLAATSLMDLARGWRDGRRPAPVADDNSIAMNNQARRSAPT